MQVYENYSGRKVMVRWSFPTKKIEQKKKTPDTALVGNVRGRNPAENASLKHRVLMSRGKKKCLRFFQNWCANDPKVEAARRMRAGNGAGFEEGQQEKI